MAVQTSTTGQLENAAKEMIVTARYTEEHNAPCMELVEHFTLGKGHDTLIVPKVGQITLDPLVEGVDIASEKDIGMTTVSVGVAEIGGKVIITDKLLRQNTQDIWRIVGRQLGDGMARRKDRDIIALFTALNGGTTLGAAGTTLDVHAASGCVAFAKDNRFGPVTELRAVHHPNAIVELSKSLATIGAGTFLAPLPKGFSADKLSNFYTGVRMSGCSWFETGNIDADGSDDGIGAIFDQGAMGTLTQLETKTERERDASLRAWELVICSDYNAFEIDDTRGAPMTYDIGDVSTTGGAT